MAGRPRAGAVLISRAAGAATAGAAAMVGAATAGAAAFTDLGWGWGGLGLGLYFATLPWYYSTLWWDGVPYYYADNTYYRWNGSVNQYETVVPPPGLQDQAGQGGGEDQVPSASGLIAYPKTVRAMISRARTDSSAIAGLRRKQDSIRHKLQARHRSADNRIITGPRRRVSKGADTA